MGYLEEEQKQSESKKIILRIVSLLLDMTLEELQVAESYVHSAKEHNYP